jgi:hypothetical protein
VDRSRFPKAFPFSSATWHPAPVFVRTHDVERIGAIVCWKYVSFDGSLVVHDAGRSARVAAPPIASAVASRRDLTLVREGTVTPRITA